MNIFEKYLSIISKVILENKNFLKLTDLKNLNNINLEVPPEHFNYDLSSNISLVLGKSNKLNPINLANDIKDLLLKKINHFERIDIAGPCFLNIKLSKEALIKNINDIFENRQIRRKKFYKKFREMGLWKNKKN